MLCMYTVYTMLCMYTVYTMLCMSTVYTMLCMTLTLTLIIVYFDNSTTKSNNQCSTFRINTNSFNVERHGDHIKTYIHVDIT